MTTFEHALLGMNGLLATGLQRTHGWKLAALAAVAAIAPDWDGLPMLIDMARFESGHRVWGHNVLACVLTGILLGIVDYRFDIAGRIAKVLTRFGPMKELKSAADVRETFATRSTLIWIIVAILAALSQIPADAVVSGAEGLSDWAIKPFWPFSDWPLVYAMVPWGNIGVTLIFAIAMIAQIKRPSSTQRIAITALLAVIAYIVFWGLIVHQR